jgi:TusA-related sulfurtransferase
MTRMSDTSATNNPDDRPHKAEDVVPVRLDLVGVACPLNWARAKAQLETMKRGQQLEVIVDDPNATRDLPRAAEIEGHCVIWVRVEAGQTRILIEA